VRKAEKIETPLSLCALQTQTRAVEGQQPSLFGMQSQPESSEAFAEHGHHAPGINLLLEE
jgi:hypothetical protein